MVSLVRMHTLCICVYGVCSSQYVRRGILYQVCACYDNRRRKKINQKCRGGVAFIFIFSRSPRWTSGSPRMPLVLVREFESRRGEVLSLIPHLSLCVNFQSFFSFWTACATLSIEVDATEQQVARHNQPNTYIIYICARQIDNKILRSNIHDIGRNH